MNHALTKGKNWKRFYGQVSLKYTNSTFTLYIIYVSNFLLIQLGWTSVPSLQYMFYCYLRSSTEDNFTRINSWNRISNSSWKQISSNSSTSYACPFKSFILLLHERLAKTNKFLWIAFNIQLNLVVKLHIIQFNVHTNKLKIHFKFNAIKILKFMVQIKRTQIVLYVYFSIFKIASFITKN